MVEVILHDIGEGMTQADILSFFVKPGDEVKPDQPLVEVQTDKMVAEIPAPTAGTVKELKVQTGECVKVGSILLTIEATSKQPVKVEGSTAPSESKTQNKVLHIEKSEKRTMAAPFTRKIARELGVDLNEIKGSGPAGRITDSDVKAAYEKMKNPDIQMVTEVQTPIEEPQTLVSMEEEISKPTVIPYRGRRKQIGQKMAQSLYSIPQCTHYEEIDVTNLLSMRTEWKQVKKNVSATAYFIKAISIALKEYPIFNATLIEKEELIHLHNEHHIGIATDTEDGLIVP
ncbi:MAG: 2-oxo acid dehydrogenase subunit E2, partial [Bacillaceae bacterium]|nr:2-oxo acid dehydrogenase subunit E2 [Bacillaceae bacterium]